MKKNKENHRKRKNEKLDIKMKECENQEKRRKIRERGNEKKSIEK